MAAVIYCIHCSGNDKSYIGRTLYWNSRKMRHLSVLRGGKHENEEMQKAFKEFGEATFSFEVLEHCKRECLGSRKKLWMDEIGRENLFNTDTRKKTDEDSSVKSI